MIIALQTLLFFRDALISVIERFLGPYYRKLTLKFKSDEIDDDEESDDHVFAEYDNVKGVVFYPPVYAQRYAAVGDCLMDERWCGTLEKVVDLGYHDMKFINYLKDMPGIKHILGVDLEYVPQQCLLNLMDCGNYVAKREKPLQITLFQGNAADPDYRLIGCDAVVAIEMIEHMLPHDLERLVHTVFGFIKPRIAIFTTPNGDFNVLFKALEENGLRRLDHMFEWSREQFHDWCSNIVARYPNYTVTSKGIGPGPPDTFHLGCCSQLALFVAKEYTKQPDLDVNSLALVAKTSSPNDLNHIIEGFETPISTVETNISCTPPSVASYPALMYDETSRMTIVLASSSSSLDPMEYSDKILQCNLDSEIGKSFLMFDDEAYFNVLVPRREKHFRVYEIEDVASRLNCSTFQVKKFSKVTQGLMARNETGSGEHMREIAQEIRYLTNMLNFNKDPTMDRELEGTWRNINWGVNAPYWNQYYRIVREYSYPFEFQTDETLVLDFVTAEIDRLIEYDAFRGCDKNKLEIPIEHLMKSVEHITGDVDKVKELLVWNGYDVVGDLVIQPRRILDDTSEGSQEDGQDELSDWDTTEVRSTSVSDGGTIAPDPCGLRLQRAIDKKVRKLRTLLTTDDDITAVLERVVCRLMKLALSKSKGRQEPPPLNWMQCKLFDLLTLAVKSVERRLQRYSLKAIEYHKDIISHDEVKKNPIGDVIVSKYENLNLPPDDKICINGDLQKYGDSEFDDCDISITSNEFKDEFLELQNNIIQEEPYNDPIKDWKKVNDTENIELFVEETGQISNCNLELVPYPCCRSISSLINSEESNCSTSNGAGKKQEQLENNNEISLHEKYKINCSGAITPNKTITKKQSNSTFKIKHNIHRASTTKISKTVSCRRSSYNLNVLKYDSIEYKKYKLKGRKKPKAHQMHQSTPSRPIPGSLIELCHLQTNANLEKFNSTISNSDKKEQCQRISNIAATEKCMFIGIVTEDGEETIAMKRNIGISPEFDIDSLEYEDELETVINLSEDNSYYDPKIETGNVQSQTIFIFDLDEPSTSKGVRHLSTDVQCGPDVTIASPLPSRTTAFTNMPKLLSTGIKIGEQSTNMKTNINTYDSGTCTEMCDSTITVDKKSVGIKIKESIEDVTECSTTTQLFEDKTFSTSAELTNFASRMETNMKPNINTYDSGTCTEICDSTITVGRKSVGIKIKESIEDVTECSTMTQVFEDKTFSTSAEFNNFASRMETKLKPVSSVLKIESSGSKICGISGSHVKSLTRLAILSKNTNDFQIPSVSNEKNIEVKISQAGYDTNNLVCGGIHVHSFKERQVSEDVVYQGEWQRNQSLPKRNHRQNLHLPKRQKLYLKDYSRVNEIKKIPQIIVSVSKPKSTINTPTLNQTAPNKKKYSNIPVKTTKNNSVNINKVASKVAISSHISKNMKTIYTTKKRTSVNKVENILKKEECDKNKKINNYLPLYLRRRKMQCAIKNNNVENISENKINMKSENIILKENLFPPTNTKEVTKDLIMMPEKTLITDINYLIFRNEIQADNDSNVQLPLATGMIKSDNLDRSQRPPSQHSSPCSSPNSVATVRAACTRNRVTCNRINSTSSERSNSGTLESESKTVKNKKFFRRGKTNKKAPISSMLSDNKENFPETSKNTIAPNNDKEKSAKSVFLGRTKSVFMAQMTSETSILPLPSTTISKTKIQSLNKSIKLRNIKSNNTDDQVFGPPPSSSILEASLDGNSVNEDSNDCSSTNFPDNQAFKCKTFIEPSSNNSFDNDTCSIPNESDNESLNNRQSIHNTKSSILSALRKLIENKLNIPENSYDPDSDSETVILSRDDNNYVNRFNNKFSPISIDAVNINDITCDSENDVDFSHIHGPSTVDENNTVLNCKDLKSPDNKSDALSFNSFASMSTSKFSEYYLADNEFESTIPQVDTLNINSIQDIFERKEMNTIPNLGGLLAVQAFSGFSVNEPLTGDQPDFVNYIDSETGSFGFQSARQAASEEIFVSGRSSDTYESCYVDEDAYVPNWLFDMIRQQQSTEESEAEEINITMQMPVEEPGFDMNGNAIEPAVRVGAGAGDGRGMHSDNSQDSSGRGTSLSSSETSSGVQSEAIAIDPSSFTAQVDYLREPLNISAMNGAPSRPESSAASNTGENNGVDTSNLQNRSPRNLINLIQIASDVEADVSSLGTDAVDSDS